MRLSRILLDKLGDMGYSVGVKGATKTARNETMRMTETGAVQINGHSARRTDRGDWQVSRLGTSIGYVDTLAEVEGLIARHLERVRRRLALVQRKAAERKERTLANIECLSKAGELHELWGDAEDAFDRGDYDAGNAAKAKSIELEKTM